MSERYLNRELSWLAFNSRVLAEAENADNPLLERLRFLAIFESNLDEFFMVRVSGLIEQFENRVVEMSPDGLSPNEQLEVIAQAAGPLRRQASLAFSKKLIPVLEAEGLHLRKTAALSEKQTASMRRYFQRQVFPLCTPLVLSPAPSVPFISNRSLNLVVELADGNEAKLARVKIPTIVPRFVPLGPRKDEFILLEDLIADHVADLFPGVEIKGTYRFRVIRDADIELRELEASDLIATVEESLRLRRFGDPVLLQHESEMPAHIVRQLRELIGVGKRDTMEVPSLLGMEALEELVALDRPRLRYPPHHGYVAEPLANSNNLFDTLDVKDALVHHPFDSFRSVEALVESAIKDPQVAGIKLTLYRVGTESVIVEDLAQAAEAGKQVAACVELKARFDESNNIVWARALERAGAHVVYGFYELKTHCKMCLVVRRAGKELKAYVHIGTGNYNPQTARQYTDLGLFTSDPEIARDVSEVFNYLTGFSKRVKVKHLLVAPINLREGILERIARESKRAAQGEQARIVFKLNALVDPEVIEALYKASSAGVSVDLIIRGICCLRPGVPDLSKNIRVVSIVGRFLEHSRVYYFHNGGQAEAYIGSADAMRRNLDRRVEVLAPIRDPALVERLREEVLEPYLRDNTNAWRLDGTGSYTRLEPDGKPFTVQTWLMGRPLGRFLGGS
ncbi:MAG: polyphosphate kinase 1 [Chthonomonadaceae bacterium]|nr:polyphosphate kinase 1 [Chthonomonadaceae bacterium]